MAAVLRARSRVRREPPSTSSWWLNPDADWAEEQARMHTSNESDCRNLIGWKAVGTSTHIRPAHPEAFRINL